MSTELFKKLRLTSGKKMLILNAPAEFTVYLEEMIYEERYPENSEQQFDYVQLFATTQAEMEKELLRLGNAGKFDCIFWICYPKGSGKIRSDIKRDTVWKAMELIRLRPVTQVAINETWSALRGRPDETVGK